MEFDEESSHQKVVYYLSLTLGTSGILLNLMTLVVLFNVKPKELGPHLILLKSLSLADLIVCVFAVLKINLQPSSLPYAAWSDCMYSAFFKQCSFCYTATFLSLILISVNLYLAITEPLRYNQLVTLRRIWATLGTIWCVAVLVHCVDILQASIRSRISDDGFCDILQGLELSALTWKIFTGMVFLGGIALCGIYIKIFLVAKRNLKQTDSLDPDQFHQQKAKKHSLNTSLLLLGTFVLVYVPYCALFISHEAYQRRLSVTQSLNDEAYAQYLKTLKPSFSEDYQACSELDIDEKFECLEDLFDVTGTRKSLDHYFISLDEVSKVEFLLKLTLLYMEPILLLNSICDPLIYVIRMDCIRKVYRSLMCYFCERNSGNI